MATFGLVHGAWHGAWCWEPLAAELELRGHASIRMDLPCEDREATFSDYASVVVDALGAASDVVLVGHSLADMTIPLVAGARPVRLMVFLCALVPERAGEEAAGMPAQFGEGAYDPLVHHADGSNSWPTLETATEILYHDCEPQLAAGAFARLRRQQTALWDTVRALERWPDVASASIHCREDRAISADWSRWIARRRLGVESHELPGGHSPMLAQPSALANTLVALTNQ